MRQFSCCRAAKHRCASSVVSGDVCLGGCCVFAGCQSSFGVGVSSEPAAVCQWLFVSKWVAGGEGGRRGTKCSSVPTTRHPRECALSSWLLCWDAGMRKWVVSVLDRHVEWVTCSASPCFSGDVGPLYESGCVLTEEVDARDGGC